MNFETLLGKLLGTACRQLLAGFKNDFTRVGIDHIRRGLEALEAIHRERNPPGIAITAESDGVVECRQDFFRIHAKRHQQRRRRNLAAAVDTRIDNVLGVEFDIEPGTAIRNDASGKQQLA